MALVVVASSDVTKQQEYIFLSNKIRKIQPITSWHLFSHVRLTILQLLHTARCIIPSIFFIAFGSRLLYLPVRTSSSLSLHPHPASCSIPHSLKVFSLWAQPGVKGPRTQGLGQVESWRLQVVARAEFSEHRGLISEVSRRAVQDQNFIIRSPAPFVTHSKSHFVSITLVLGCSNG